MTNITMPDPSVLMRLAARAASRAAYQWDKHEQIGPMSHTITLETIARKYMAAVTEK